MDPQPYGGFMTRTLDAEKEQQDKLKEQQVDIVVNGTTETLRPEALHIRGVDNLATDDIKAFVDYYLNYSKNEETGEYTAPDDLIWFRVQWIDDTNVNIVFKTHDEAKKALKALSISSGPNSVEDSEDFSQEYVSSIIQEREANPYNPSIEFHRYQKELKRLAEAQDDEDLFEKKKEKLDKEKEEATEMDEDESSVVLYLRQAFQSDRKVLNAAAYSRYYLLHGEPDRLRPRKQRNAGRTRGNFTRDEGEDLFAEKLSTRSRRESDEEDLFAEKLRERSPSRR